MSILVSIGMWLLRALLGGVVGKLDSAATEEANRQKDAALLKAETIETGKTLEVDAIKKDVEIEAKFNADKQARPVDDPFGIKKFNQGEQS